MLRRRNITSDRVGQMAEAALQTVPAQQPVVVKKYANRRLYNTESSSYVTLEDLAKMIRDGREFVVYDAKSGEDITRSVLTQIIVEEEAKGGQLLPESFLRQLIGFYGGSMQSVVPKYLEATMQGFARQQDEIRRNMANALKPFSFEEMGRQNLAMMERAMSLFSPFPRQQETESLRAENEALRAEVAALKARG